MRDEKRNLQAYADWLAGGGGGGALAGASRLRPGLRATLFVGRNVDALKHVVGCSTSAGEIGEALTARERARKRVSPDRILEIAQAEVGGATLTLGRGLFERRPEPTSALVVIAPPGAGARRFHRDVARLGERLARKLAQQEVLIEYTTAKGPEMQDVSPEGLPAPVGDRKRLKAAIAKVAARCGKRRKA